MKRMDGSYSQTRRVARSNFGRNDGWKITPRKTTIAIHESDYRRPRIEEGGQRQGNIKIVANQSLN